MPTTPNYGLPYSTLQDPPNGAQQQQELASATDAALNNVETSIENRLDERIVGTRLWRSTAQSIPAGTRVPIVFDTMIVVDYGVNWNGSDTVTISQGGIFVVSAWYRNFGGTNEDRYVYITVNGSILVSNSTASSANSGASGSVPCSPGDEVRAELFDGGGGQLEPGTPHFSVFRIGTL